MEIGTQTTVLVRRRQPMGSLERSLMLLLVALCLGTIAYLFRWELLDVELLLRMGSALLGKPDLLLQAIALSLLFAVVILLERGLTIHVDSTGIQLHSTLPMRRSIVIRNVPWERVAAVSYVPRTGFLSIHPSKGLPWALRACEWVDPAATDRAGDASGEPVLVGLLRQRGLLDRKSAAAIVTEFDLMSDSRTRLLVCLGAALGLYAVFDGMYQRESWAFFNAEYLLPHLVVGAVVAAITGAKLLRPTATQALPREIVFGLAVFIAIAALPASYAAGVRVNQVFGGPLEAGTYHRDRECMNLVPTDAELPVIEYTSMTKAYWCRISEEQPVQVLVRRGLFGLYQVNLKAQSDDIRRFLTGR